MVVIVYFTTFTTEDFKTAAGDNLKCFLLCVYTYKCITTTSRGFEVSRKMWQKFLKRPLNKVNKHRKSWSIKYLAV